MIELIIEVDKNDKIIGKRPKKDFLGTDLIHRASLLLLFNSENKLLIQKRDISKKLFPDTYDFSVTGTVRDKESYRECIKREMKEELGIDIAPKELFKYSFFDEWDKAFRMVYSTIYDGKFKIQKSELSSIKWVGLEELKKDINKNSKNYSPSFIAGIEIFIQKQKTR